MLPKKTVRRADSYKRKRTVPSPFWAALVAILLLIVILLVLISIEQLSFSSPPVLHWSGQLNQLIDVAGTQTILSVFRNDSAASNQSNTINDEQWQLIEQLADGEQWRELADSGQRQTYIAYSQRQISKILPAGQEAVFSSFNWRFAINDHYILVSSYVDLISCYTETQRCDFLLVYQPGSFTPLLIVLTDPS